MFNNVKPKYKQLESKKKSFDWKCIMAHRWCGGEWGTPDAPPPHLQMLRASLLRQQGATVTLH